MHVLAGMRHVSLLHTFRASCEDEVSLLAYNCHPFGLHSVSESINELLLLVTATEPFLCFIRRDNEQEMGVCFGDR